MAIKRTIAVDTGTTTVDWLDDTHGSAALWMFKISDGTNMMGGLFFAFWDEIADSNPSTIVWKPDNIGTVTGITFEVDKNVNTVWVRVTSTSDGWEWKSSRIQVGP